MKSRASQLLCFALVACLAPAQAPATLEPARLTHAEAIPVDAKIPEDPAVQAFLAPYEARMKAEFGRVLCQSPEGLFRAKRGGSESPLGFWMADLMRTRAEALLGKAVPAALTNSGGIRANLRPGPVTVGSIYEVSPFDNELVVVELKGADLITALRAGLERRAGEPCSGVKVSLKGSVAKPEVEIRWADGRVLDPTKSILVATNDFLATNGDTMAGLAKGGRILHTGLTIRQLLLDACEQLGKEGKTLNAPSGGRYLVAPELLQALAEHKLKLVAP